MLFKRDQYLEELKKRQETDPFLLIPDSFRKIVITGDDVPRNTDEHHRFLYG